MAAAAGNAAVASAALERALAALSSQLRGRSACLLAATSAAAAAPLATSGEASAGLSDVLGRLPLRGAFSRAEGAPPTSPASGPLFVARPETVADVERCVRCAGELGLSVSAVGGAHSEHCVMGSMVLDMQHFCDVAVDPAAETVTVGGGAIAKSIQERAAEHDLMVPLGTAPTVGMGLVLQGGIGHLSRPFGLSLDSLVSASVVVADGRCLVASSSENVDLLWGLRGAGTNFGVVISATLSARRIRHVAASARVVAIKGDDGGARQLLLAYAERSAALARDASADCILHYSKDGRLCMGVYDYAIHGPGGVPPTSTPLGAELSGLAEEVLSERELPCVPVLSLFDHEPYLYEQPHGTLLAHSSSLGFFVRAVFMASPLTPEVADQLLSRMRAAPCQHCFVHFQHAGGAVGDVACDATAFASRRLEWSVVVSGCWPAADAERLQQACVDWVHGVVQALLPNALGVYSTDLGPNDHDLARFAFGSNATELLRLKQRWDPQSVFSRGFPLNSLGRADGPVE